VTPTPIGSDESNLIAEAAANIGASAGAPVAERNYANNYAAYWQARSGFFTLPSEPDQARHPSGGQWPASVRKDELGEAEGRGVRATFGQNAQTPQATEAGAGRLIEEGG
jgi:hypothetical protein